MTNIIFEFELSKNFTKRLSDLSFDPNFLYFDKESIF